MNMMWRFVLGVFVGVVLTCIVFGGLPFKWNTDPDRNTLNKAQDKFIIVIGTDENLDFISQYKINSHDGEDRLIHIYRSKEDADKARKHLVKAWSEYQNTEKK